MGDVRTDLEHARADWVGPRVADHTITYPLSIYPSYEDMRSRASRVWVSFQHAVVDFAGLEPGGPRTDQTAEAHETWLLLGVLLVAADWSQRGHSPGGRGEAPDFTLPGTTGEKIRFEQFRVEKRFYRVLCRESPT